MTITVAEPYLKIGRLNSHVTRVPEEDKKPKKNMKIAKKYFCRYTYTTFSRSFPSLYISYDANEME